MNADTDAVTFAHRIVAGARLLGLDVGAKTIGVATADSSWRIASPVQTVRRRRPVEDAAALLTLAQERNIAGLVIGLPVTMSGDEGPRCQSVRQFAQNLRHAGVSWPVLFWDERLSTRAVERVLVEEADISRRRRRAVVDTLAATVILQNALEALNNAGVRQGRSESR